MTGKGPQAVLLVLLGGLLYANSLSVPFYFDDIGSIVNNPGITRLDTALRNLFSLRGFSFLTFAVNYQVGGLQVFSYHLVNLAIHIGAGLLVFALLLRFFPGDRRLPMLGAAVFLAHPLQTQAVTYVVQRLASLATFFVLLAVYCYLRARDNRPECAAPPSRLWYPAALLAVLFAVLSKENTVVAPALLLLSAWLFEKERFSLRRELTLLAPFLLGGAVVAGYLVTSTSILQSSLGSIELFVAGESGRTELAAAIPDVRLRYFATQLVVFWRYLGLLLLPWGQTLDYSYPLVDSVASLPVILAALGITGLSLAVLRSGNRYLLFGLLWFVLGLAVESSFIPLDPLFEHRLYLPMFGVVVALCALLRSYCPERLVIPLGLAVVVLLGGLTLARINLWRDPVAFWQDNLRKAPHSYRVRIALAEAYLKAGNETENMRMVAEALEREASPAMIANVVYHDNLLELGKAYMRHNRVEEAIRLLERAARYYPQEAMILLYLGEAYATSGNLPKAARYVAMARELDSGDPTIEQQYRKYFPSGR